MNLLCKHNYCLASETTTESKMEHLRSLLSVTKLNGVDVEEMCKRKHIQTFTCTKCGELKRFVEDI